jgi:hypothetical protein
VNHVGYLLAAIEDPFQIFPLESVANNMGELVANSFRAISEQSGWYGVARRYYSDEQEHYMQKISLLIGASFVLGQAAITQTVALALKLGELVGKPSWLPNSRAEVLQTAATFHVKTRLSDLAIIDAVANYFKHHHEWPLGWDLGQAKGAQRNTIKIALSLGLSPESEEESLQAALQGLGLSERSMRTLGGSIRDWRDRLAEDLRERLCEHNIV